MADAAVIYDYGSSYGSTGSVNGNAAPGDTTRLIRSSRSSTPVRNGRQGSDDGYEELFKDSVPCPSCRGLGRVPRDQESQLVALIPMRDKRLKPRRTVQYVVVMMVVCLLVMGLCLFFLFPRNVVVSSNRPLLKPLSLDLNTSASFVNLTVTNFYNFTNDNFYPVKILGGQMIAMYEEKVLATTINHTKVDVGIKSYQTYSLTMDLVLSKANEFGFLVAFCEDSRPWVHNLPIRFELAANYTYLGHVEQTSLQTFQQVSCYNGSASLQT
ncbi:transmembrane protein 106B-like isoform X2 [Littorina saxatilis]